MSSKCMIIDQYHRETRVAIVKNRVLEDFDYEVVQNKLKKGNLYWARVMRVEPSLQAAFLDFGGERHGFLAFSEIHPSYYQIEKKPMVHVETRSLEGIDGEEDEDLPKPKVNHTYKIQEVIKKNQEMLVQISKDSRGTKGAALTTYISLPGRYSVLLPNTPGSSGISKKITAAEDRDQLKEIVASLEVPETMSIIVRTAGLGKKRGEIKRDYEYLIRLWSEIEKKSVAAPGLVHEEQDLLIRALRDLYASDIEEILIQGEPAFRKARAFMKVFMPSHGRRVSLYDDPALPLFEKFEVETQIDAIYDTAVTLPSGGSIMIHATEALVAIDVNSAKSTGERNIEDTALKTNLEAVPAIARQLRLRDLAGLIVIDFIDMAPSKCAQVEKAMKEELKQDRARTRVGKISAFGLLEMSRQRLRQSLLESNTLGCTVCRGTGRMMSPSISAMKVLRFLGKMKVAEKEKVMVFGSPEVVSCLLNEYRSVLHEMEKKANCIFHIVVDGSLPWAHFRVTEETKAPVLHARERCSSFRFTKQKVALEKGALSSESVSEVAELVPEIPPEKSERIPQEPAILPPSEVVSELSILEGPKETEGNDSALVVLVPKKRRRWRNKTNSSALH